MWTIQPSTQRNVSLPDKASAINPNSPLVAEFCLPFLVSLYLNPWGRTDRPSPRINNYTDTPAWDTERLFWALGLEFMSYFSILFELGFWTTNCALRYGFWWSPLIHLGSSSTQHSCASRWLIHLCSSACLIWIPECPRGLHSLRFSISAFPLWWLLVWLDNYLPCKISKVLFNFQTCCALLLPTTWCQTPLFSFHMNTIL